MLGALLVFFPLATGAQGLTPVVYGRVTSLQGDPVPSAVIEVIGSRWATRSAPDGSFKLGVPGVRPILRASRIGYRADSIAIDVEAGVPPAEVVFRLSPAHHPLSSVTVEAARMPGMARTVTSESVRRMPALVESDVFRAVAALPMISQPNDLKGRIHLAGGASDETGVTLDGHPLQDPFHLLGVLGAFNIGALERADVLMHHVPVGQPARLSGVVALETRRPVAAPAREIVTSLLASSATVTSSDVPFGLDLLASGRVSYLDRIVRLVTDDPTVGGDDLPLPGYHDAIVRFGRAFSPAWRAEVVAFNTRDVLPPGRIAEDSGQGSLSWGESMAGLTIRRHGPLWDLAVRTSANRASVREDSSAYAARWMDVQRDWFAASAEMTRRGMDWEAAAGATIDARRHQNRWHATAFARDMLSPNAAPSYDGVDRHMERGVFGEVSWDVRPSAAVSAGLKMVTVGDRWYAAPRMMASFAAGRNRVELSLDRRHQFFAELEEPIEGNISPPMFLLEVPRRADIAAFSAERRGFAIPARGAALLRLEGFYKRYADRPVLRDSARAGLFPDFLSAAGTAYGASIGGQADWGERASIQGSYTFQSARERRAEDMYPTSWDAPHDVSLVGATPIGGRWSLTAAYRGHSGRAIAPIVGRVLIPAPEMSTGLWSRTLLGPRNSARVPAYHRLDLGVRKPWEYRGAGWVFFAQVLNAFNRGNAVGYDWQSWTPTGSGASRAASNRTGLPVLPTFGVEVAW